MVMIGLIGEITILIKIIFMPDELKSILFSFFYSFSLRAKVTFYADCVPAGQTQFSWSVDNDQVVLNLKTAETSTLYVDANSLPGLYMSLYENFFHFYT